MRDPVVLIDDALLWPVPKLSASCRLVRADKEGFVLYVNGDAFSLNASGGEILLRCDGIRPIEDIVLELEQLFCARGIALEVHAFVREARSMSWLE